MTAPLRTDLMARNVRLLYFHNFLTDFRFSTPFVVIYLAEVAGSYTAAMTLLSVEMASMALAQIPTGLLSDRIGRRRTIALGSCAAAAGLAGYALASGMPLLVTGAVLLGLSGSLFSGNNDALLYESLKEQERAKEFHHYQGRISSMFQLALGLSALCASLMTDYGLRLIFLLAVIPQVLAIGVSLFFTEPRRHEKRETGFALLKSAFINLLRNSRLRLLVLAQAISWGGGESRFQLQMAYVNTLWPVWALGIFKACNHAFGFMGSWMAGRVIERITPHIALILRESYWFVSQTFALIVNNLISPVLFMTGSLLFGPGQVARDKLLQEDFTDAERATLGSIASFAGSLVYALSALAIGFTADRFGLIWGMALGVGITALSLPLYTWLFRNRFVHE